MINLKSDRKNQGQSKPQLGSLFYKVNMLRKQLLMLLQSS